MFTNFLEYLPSPEHAETVAICEGLCSAKRFGYTSFTLESDCKGFIDQLKSRSWVLSSLGHVHTQIHALVDRLIVLSFARCITNVPIHLLAAKAVLTYPSNVWMEVMQDFITTAIQADLI